MAKTRISELPVASAIAGTEELPIVQSGANKKTTPNDLRTYIGDPVTLAGAYDYLTLSGQEITLGQVDLTTDVTGVLPVANYATGTPDGTKFVRDDGTLQSIPGGGDALTANPLSQFAATTSAELAGVISDETGTGALVFANSPTLVTPAIGTPSSGNLSNCTNYAYANLTGAPTISAYGATLIDDIDAAAARTTLGVDAAGTDNSTDVTLTGAYNYLTLSGQQITLGQVDLTTDVTGVLPVANYATGVPDGTKFVRDDGTLQPIPGGGDALTANPLSQFAATTSAQLAGVISDETGSGSLVFGTSPTLVTPALGTPTSVTLTNGTGLPISTGVSGLGTNVATFLATPSSANLRAALTDESGTGLAYFQGGALGTPASGTLTSCTGLPISTGVSGLGTGVAAFLATPSSANLATAVTGETGSGALVFATSPTLVTPILGTPTSGTLTNCTGLPWSGIVSADEAAQDAAAAALTTNATHKGITFTYDDAGNGIDAATKVDFVIPCSDETTALTTGVKATFRMPFAMTLEDVQVTVTTAPTGSTLEASLSENGSSVLSTNVTIDAGEKTSATAATPPVISDSALAEGAEMVITVVQVGATVAGAGLKFYLIGERA